MTTKTLSKKPSSDQKPARRTPLRRAATKQEPQIRLKTLEASLAAERERCSQLAEWVQLLAGTRHDAVDSKPFLVEMLEVVAREVEMLDLAVQSEIDLDVRPALNCLWWRIRAALEAAPTIEHMRRTALVEFPFDRERKEAQR